MERTVTGVVITASCCVSWRFVFPARKTSGEVTTRVVLLYRCILAVSPLTFAAELFSRGCCEPRANLSEKTAVGDTGHRNNKSGSGVQVGGALDANAFWITWNIIDIDNIYPEKKRRGFSLSRQFCMLSPRRSLSQLALRIMGGVITETLLLLVDPPSLRRILDRNHSVFCACIFPHRDNCWQLNAKKGWEHHTREPCSCHTRSCCWQITIGL